MVLFDMVMFQYLIELSTYNDTKQVMQWIKNSACDCLVKHVGIQDLQHI